MFIILRSEKNLWTVGCMSPEAGTVGAVWCPLKDCDTAEQAMSWINYLNGGTGQAKQHHTSI